MHYCNYYNEIEYPFNLIQFWCVVTYYFRPFWQKLLDLAKCHILSECSNDEVDAYILRSVALRGEQGIASWLELLCKTDRSFKIVPRLYLSPSLCLSSESSMFISKNRFILKTCGTTSLLYTVKPLLATVKEFYPESEVKVMHCYKRRRRYFNSCFILGLLLFAFSFHEARSPDSSSSQL